MRKGCLIVHWNARLIVHWNARFFLFDFQPNFLSFSDNNNCIVKIISLTFSEVSGRAKVEAKVQSTKSRIKFVCEGALAAQRIEELQFVLSPDLK